MPKLNTKHLLTGLVLISSLATSYAMWNYTQRSAELKLQHEFEFHIDELITHIQQRMTAYQQVLLGMRALFGGSSKVTREEFSVYVSSLLLDQYYPGIQGLSHAMIVPHAQKQQHINDIRKQGFPDYTIFPAGEREVYTPVYYIEPFTERNAKVLGYDTFAEPMRRNTMIMARDHNRAVISGKLTLVQEDDDEQQQAGFLMFLPLYTNGMPYTSLAERQAAIYGWVTAVFRMGDLMAGLGHAHAAELAVEIYDGETISDQTRMYDSDDVAFNAEVTGSRLKNIQRISIGNHIWTIVSQSTPVFEQRLNNNLPLIVGITGIAFSLLLTMLAHALVRAKKITSDLAESEQRWRYALEGAGEGVWDWNIETDEVKCSRRWKEMLGYNDRELQNHFGECEKHIHPDDHDHVIADIQAHFKGNTPVYENEHRTLHKDGSWRWILDRGMVINRSDDGKPLRMIGTHTDITQRKQSETQLKEQRDFIDAVVEVAGNIIVVLDLSGNIVRFNRAAEKMTGYHRDELLGKPVWNWVIPEEQIEAVKNVFENLKSGNLDIAGRYVNDWMTRDGNRVTLDWHNTILRNDDDEITHIVALGYDITERIKYEEKIQRLSRLYVSLSHCDQAIVHSANQEELFPQICLDAVKHGGFKMAWIGLLDEASRQVLPVASYGEGTENLQQVSISVDQDQPEGRGPTGTAIRENHPVWSQDCQNDAITQPWHHYCKQYDLKASAALPLSINGTAIGAFNLYAGEVNAFDEDARELLQQMASDISFALDSFARENQRKQAEEELSRLNLSLESRVRERTDELTQAKELADAASRAKSDFLSNMSHEIRTPLTAILGFSEALLSNDFDQQEREKLTSTIVRNSKHLQQIINDILDLSKIESGQLELEYIDTSPFSIVAEVDSLLGVCARDKGLEFNVNYHFPLPRQMITDPTYLKQILINLCSNAIKFTAEGYVNVEVSCDEACNTISFDVIDSGIGMTRNEVEHVFDPFTQGDSTTTRKYGGTGLGLSISSNLAKVVGGELSCVSEKGKGTCFTLTLNNINIDQASLVNSMEEASTNPETQQEHAEIKPLTGNILLVEDNPDNQQLISMYVRKTGANMDIADNGQTGVDMALAKNYNLILMDMQMPELDGLQAITRLRKQGYTSPIVSLTANAMLSNREQCIAAGANDYLVKPVDLPHFYEVLNRYLTEADNTEVIETGVDQGSDNKHSKFYSSPRYLAIVERFKQKLPEMVAEITDAVHSKNWDLAKAKSHDLKGIGGAMGFAVITDIARRLSDQVSNQDYDQAAQTSTELENVYQDILQE